MNISAEPCSRRELLSRAACGFGSLALAGIAAEAARGATPDPLAPKPPMLPARAKRVIFLFMRGGPSHMDTFDYKPLLQKRSGQDSPIAVPKLQALQRTSLGKNKLFGSPFRFAQHGDSGQWISELFPRVARCADDLCVLNGMHTNGVDHGQAIIKLYTGQDALVRPSLGSWVLYGLGTENQNLPGFVTIGPQRSEVGTRSYGSAFLPAALQGTPLGSEDVHTSRASIAHLSNQRLSPEQQRQQLALLDAVNREHLQRSGPDGQLEGVIQSFELAYRMQTETPQILDLSRESAHTLDNYGIGREPTDDFARQCLLARRFVEAGVRFVQVTHSVRKLQPGIADWDQHGNLARDLPINAAAVDQPIAALLADLKSRGLLEDTLVWWGGEFGRTPISEFRGGGGAGRDHNPFGFTMWLAGGGVRGGFRYGATDEVGYHAVQDKVHMHDLHATILHLLGLDHERLTYRYAGRDFRLTDVYGRVVREIFA